jgi:hypothetical protein
VPIAAVVMVNFAINWLLRKPTVISMSHERAVNCSCSTIYVPRDGFFRATRLHGSTL